MPSQPLLPVRLLLAAAPRVEPFTRPALVVAPHPDDETFGCGGVIATKRARGVPVRVVFMTDGSRSHGELEGEAKAALVARRQREAIAACAALGVPAKDITFFGLPDGELRQTALDAEARRETARQVREIIDSVEAAELFVTYRRDRHKDHEAAFSLAARAASKANRAIELYEYPVWVRNGLNRWLQRVGLAQYRTARAVPLTPEALAAKRAASASHASQHETLPAGFAERFMTDRELFFVSPLDSRAWADG